MRRSNTFMFPLLLFLIASSMLLLTASAQFQACGQCRLQGSGTCPPGQTCTATGGTCTYLGRTLPAYQCQGPQSTSISTTTTTVSGGSNSGSGSGSGQLPTLLSSELCGIVNSIQAIVGLLALALFLIGGVMYAIAHFLPPSVDFRKSLIGWSTAMITGGIIGLIVVIIAPSIVSMFAGAANAIGSGTIQLYSC